MNGVVEMKTALYGDGSFFYHIIKIIIMNQPANMRYVAVVS